MNPRQEEFYRYCCKDSAVTFEINRELGLKLNRGSLTHYELNIALLNPFLYMELNGILYDKKLAKTRLEEIEKVIYTLQYEMDVLAGVGISPTLVGLPLREKIAEVCCFKRDATTPKKDYEETYPDLVKLCEKPSLEAHEIAYINTICGWSMNVKSADYKNYLYTTLGLPPQYRINADNGKKSLSTDSEALLELQKKSPHRAVELGIQIMELRTRAQMLAIKADPDGRVRTSYDVVGAVTGRITSRTSPTGSGYNLQTIPDNYNSFPVGHPLRTGMRDLFLADPGYYMFQCDLKGSDGWTIGAHLASLGDSTMLDDLRASVKPASRLCYMLRHGNNSLSGRTKAEVKDLLREVKKDDWDYFACKVGIWGICYLMGPDLLAKQIAEESYGKVWLSRTRVKDFVAAVYAAYRPQLWHRWMETSLHRYPELVSPSGHTRRFFDRPQNRLGQALAHEPQSVTTYATNLAAYRLWTDPSNRIAIREQSDRKGLRIIPLHQVHDALIGQFPIGDTDWAVNQIRSYFANEIVIAGIPITIPFEGTYGLNWGNLDKGTI